MQRSIYDFSQAYLCTCTLLPHNLIKLTALIEQSFNRDSSHYLFVIRNATFTSEQAETYHLWSSQNVYDALHYFLNNIFIILGSKL